jgi:chitobiase/beta-hexosaminidase-like protein
MSADSSRVRPLGRRPAGRHQGRAARALRRLIPLALAGAGLLCLSSPALAGVNGTHVIAVLADTSGLELSGYGDVHNTTVTVEVVRNSHPIATGTSAIDAAGDGAVNGGGNDCWSGTTPDILPGDTIRVTAGTTIDTMVVQSTSAEAPVASTDPLDPPNTVIVHGTASRDDGSPISGAEFTGGVESRIITAGRFDAGGNGGKSLRAGAGSSFPLTPEADGIHWTAKYGDLSTHDFDLAMSPLETRAVFSNVAANEVTISQNPGARGPTPPCVAPLARSALTSSSHRPAINLANVGTDLVLSGVSEDTSDVAVKLDDGHGHSLTQNATPSATTGSGTWAVTFAAGDVAGLPDGTYAATPTFTTSTPGAGTYTGTQSVTLDSAEAGAVVHWTAGSGDPAAGLTAQPIGVTSSRTLRAVAVDAAGNASDVASFAYVIEQPTPPPPPPPSGGSDNGQSTNTVTTIIRELPIVGQPTAPATGQGAGHAAVTPGARGPRLSFGPPGGIVKLKGDAIAIVLRSDVTAVASLDATVGQHGSSSLVKLRHESRSLNRGRTTTVTLKLSKSSASAVRRALRRHRVVQVHLTIKAVDAAGDARTVTRTFRVRAA